MKIELNKVATIKDSEVTLFREMSTILSTNYSVAFIEETHQQYVSYNSSQVKQTATREISDLWIIAFSPSSQKARMTFLQAKYHRGILDNTNREFSGDFFQYELLSARPVLNSNVGKHYNFPLDILSFSCCGSIGSYGVFFIDLNNEIDLAYCSANYLTTKASLPKSYSAYRVDLEIPYNASHQLGVCHCNGCSELISCFDIDTFTNSVLLLELGAELTFYPNILTFVRDILKQKISNPTVSQFISFIDNLQPPVTATDNIFDGLPSNLLLINTDGKNSG